MRSGNFRLRGGAALWAAAHSRVSVCAECMCAVRMYFSFPVPNRAHVCVEVLVCMPTVRRYAPPGFSRVVFWWLFPVVWGDEVTESL